MRVQMTTEVFNKLLDGCQDHDNECMCKYCDALFHGTIYESDWVKYTVKSIVGNAISQLEDEGIDAAVTQAIEAILEDKKGA